MTASWDFGGFRGETLAKTRSKRALGDIQFANKKKTLEPGRPRVFRRMGEGLGGWGARHPARQDNPRKPMPFHRGLQFFSTGAAAASTPARTAAGLRPRRQIGRQIDLTAIGKFQISQADTAAAPFDDITGADREPARKT